jgi:ATP-binding cassette subfamily C (CFTR/MRP) protein 1
MYQQEPNPGADIHSPVSTPSISISHDVSRGNGFPHLCQDSGNASGRLDESAALTLMSTDIDRLTVSLTNLCEIWAYVIEMAIGIWLLEREIGWICVAPVLLTIGQCFCNSHITWSLLTSLLVSIYAASKVAAIVAPRQKVWVKAIQQRVSITSSMLGSMKSVKLMGLSDYLFEVSKSNE